MGPVLRALAALLLAAVAVPAAAGDLLHEVEARLDHARVSRGDFVQEKRLVGISRPLKGRGSFVVDRERGVLWRTEAPFKSVLKITRREIVQSDGSQVLMHLAADQEPAVKAVSAVLFATFSADLSALAQYFSFAGDAGGAAWHLVLRPKDAGLARLISSLELAGEHDVRRVDLTAASGDLLHIEFLRVETATAPTAGEAAELE
jgi:Outer membrane lipoprotein carrier protein LolA-like